MGEGLHEKTNTNDAALVEQATNIITHMRC